MNSQHERCFPLPFSWPDPPLEVALVHPKIPGNTGNIARTCAATGSSLHLVRPLAFDIDDATVKRAGLDYWHSVHLSVHDDLAAFSSATKDRRAFYFSTAGEQSLYDVSFTPGDLLVFGSETEGLPDAVLADHPESVVQVPIRTEHVRSLNLANTVALCLFEALRQCNSR